MVFEFSPPLCCGLTSISLVIIILIVVIIIRNQNKHRYREKVQAYQSRRPIVNLPESNSRYKDSYSNYSSSDHERYQPRNEPDENSVLPEKRDSDDMNVTERKLYDALRRIGLDPIPQYEVGNCKIDLAFPKNYWGFEVNGPHHYTPEGRERDKRRNQFLRHTYPPWNIRSFDAKQVYYYPDAVARKIKQILEDEPDGGKYNATW
jgi:very-short-patch-repair endonuclease